MFAVLIVPLVGYNLLPSEIKTSIANALASGQAAKLFIVVAIGLLVIDVIFIALALARFRRAKLILD